MKKIYGFLAIVSLIYVFGAAGAIEQDMVSLAGGAVRMLAGVAAFAGFSKAAGVMV